ncbi:MAG: ABC transporter permease [Spirochaetaceae bacterium]|nr:MAG: ABC transporter permease [Spirochaetaceae bacterium]
MKRSTSFQLFLIDNLIWVLVVAFFVINAVVTPRFASYRNVVNILYHSAIMSLLVLGQGLVLINGKLDLSIESTLGFAPGIAMLLSMRIAPQLVGPGMAIVITLLVGAALGWFNGICIARLKINPLLQTLASMIMIRGILLFIFPFSLFPLHPVFRYAGAGRLPGNIPVAIPLVLLVFLLLNLVLQHTPFGRRFVATGGNPRASYVSGINVDRMTLYAYVIAGVLAAVGGLLAAGRQGSISNAMGEGMVLLSFAGALMGGASLHGGKGTPLGMLGGALLLGMFSNSLNLLGVGPSLIYASKGALIFLALLLDRSRSRWRAQLLHREQLESLAISG